MQKIAGKKLKNRLHILAFLCNKLSVQSTLITPKTQKIRPIFDKMGHYFMLSVLYFTTYPQFFQPNRLTSIHNRRRFFFLQKLCFYPTKSYAFTLQ